MATVNQLLKKSRKPKVRKTDVPALMHAHKEEAYALVFIQQHLKNLILLLEKFVGLD
jgi:ribosomal protein S12